MSVLDSKLEQYFIPFLQKDIVFALNDKCIKCGKMIIFKHENFHIEFKIQCESSAKIKKFEIPYPFQIEPWNKDELLLLDYRLTSLVNNDNTLDLIQKHHNMINNNRFYNKVLELTTKERYKS